MEIFLSYGEWIKLQQHVDLYVGICWVFFFFFFDEYVWAGKFLNSRQKDFETLSCPMRCWSFNAPYRVIEVRPRVKVGMVEGTAVIMTGQPSEVGAFSRITKRLSVLFEAFFLGFNARLFGLSTPTPRIPSS
jgi:hypothetical protein